MYIHFAIHLNLIQHCKLTIPQEKKILIKKRQIWDFFQWYYLVLQEQKIRMSCRHINWLNLCFWEPTVIR